MPGPLDALKSYFSPPGDGTTSSYAPWQQTAQSAVEGGTQGILGLLGLGDDSSQANRFGQVLAAGAPFLPKGLGGVNPMFTAIGEEGTFNKARQLPPLPDPKEAAYQSLLQAHSGGGLGTSRGDAVIGRGLEGPHPAIRTLMDTLGSAPPPINPDMMALGDKVTSFQIPHRSKIQVPEGFELPSGTSPFPARPDDLIDQYVARRRGLEEKAPVAQKYGTKGSDSTVPAGRKADLNSMPGDFSSKFSFIK